MYMSTQTGKQEQSKYHKRKIPKLQSNSTVIGKIIARLNNCALLNFRAFKIYLWKKIAVIAHDHIIPCRLPGIHCGTFFLRTGGNRNLEIIRPTQKISPVTLCSRAILLCSSLFKIQTQVITFTL